MSTNPESGLQPSKELPSEILCVGEAMIMLGADEGSLSKSPIARMHVAGAESNVASGLAHLGQNVEWFGRVGNDPFGTRIRKFLNSRGVDTRNVITDPKHNTGLYFKEWAGGQSDVYYYRAGSAAAHMTASDFTGLDVEARRLCHVSGITPALSPQCDKAIGDLLLNSDRGEAFISFDVNYRSLLWPRKVAAPRILELARGADILIVGRDEAESLWGIATVEDVRSQFPETPIVVVKDADIGATSFIGSKSYFVPALSVEVVEPIGAGDAFAAGFLSAWLDGSDPVTCLRLGHVMAAYVLGSVGDTPQLPSRDELIARSAVSSPDWISTHLARPNHPYLGHSATAATIEGTGL